MPSIASLSCDSLFLIIVESSKSGTGRSVVQSSLRFPFLHCVTSSPILLLVMVVVVLVKDNSNSGQ